MEDPGITRRGELIVTASVTDVLLAKAYMQMLEDDTLDTVFFQSRPTLAGFMNEYLTPGRFIVLGCFVEREGKNPQFVGMGWAGNSVLMGAFRKCEVGMVFFNGMTNVRERLALGRMMLERVFTTHAMDVIFGVTPGQNKLALSYARRLGFKMHGPIPGYLTWQGELADGWISQMSKADWMERA